MPDNAPITRTALRPGKFASSPSRYRLAEMGLTIGRWRISEGTSLPPPLNKQSLTSEPTSVWRQSELYADYRLYC